MTHPFLIFQWLEGVLNTHLGEHVTYAWFVMLVLIIVAFLASRSIKLVPGGVQNLMEAVVGGLENLTEETMGPKGKTYFPLLAPSPSLFWFPT